MTKEEAINILESLDVRKSSYAEVSRLLRMVEDIPAITATLREGVAIHRTRMGRGYYTKGELTYKDASKCSNMQRATLPYESAFYGCISDSQEQMENARMLGLMECSALARSPKESGWEYVTASIWNVVKPIRVISFITDQSIAIGKRYGEQVELFGRIYAERHNDASSLQKRVGMFIDREFGKQVDDARDYLFTASLVHDFLYSEEYDFDAVVYPSVQSVGELGLNIVIKPSAADEKLRLYQVLDQSFYKNENRSLLRIDAGYDASHHKLSEDPISNYELIEHTGITSIEDIKFIEHK